MTGEIAVKKTRSMHPHRFGLWLFLISVVMIFISLSSAYLVKKSVGNWDYINFPPLFQLTTVLIILSSVTMQFAYVGAKRNNLRNARIGLALTGVLAIAFVVGQFKAWGQLVEAGHHFVGNPAGSFIYIFTGLHIIHLAGALIFLGVVLTNAFQYRVHSKSMLRIEMCATFWHFLGGLWLYLYLFLILNN